MIRQLAKMVVGSGISRIRVDVAVSPVSIQGDWAEVEGLNLEYGPANAAADQHVISTMDGMDQEQRLAFCVEAALTDTDLAGGHHLLQVKIAEWPSEFAAAAELYWQQRRETLL